MLVVRSDSTATRKAYPDSEFLPGAVAARCQELSSAAAAAAIALSPQPGAARQVVFPYAARAARHRTQAAGRVGRRARPSGKGAAWRIRSVAELRRRGASRGVDR